MKTINELVDESLSGRWKLIKERVPDGFGIIPSIDLPKCPFCIDCEQFFDGDCNKCRINHEICDEQGDEGLFDFYETAFNLDQYEDYQKYTNLIIQKLKEMKT